MSLWCDSILKPVCVLAVNIRRDLFWPLTVTGISWYRNASVFITGSFSTELSAPPFCARAFSARSAGSSRRKSLREHFIMGLLPAWSRKILMIEATIHLPRAGRQLLQFQESRKTLRGAAHRSRQTQLRHVMREHAVDVIQLRGRHRCLRLRDFDGIRDACLETLPGQREGFASHIQILAGHLNLAGGSLQVEKRVAHLALHQASQIFDFSPALRHRGVRLLDIALCVASLPDGDAEGSG